MTERELIVDHMRIQYEGLFDATELYKLIDRFFRDKGYDKRDLKKATLIMVEEMLKPIKWLKNFIFTIKVGVGKN